MRNADGPMSTPRRPPPRSSGTPMMWTGRIHLLSLSATPTCLRPTASRSSSAAVGLFWIAARKSRISALLVHDVVREEQAARPQARQHQVEEPLVVALPGVEKHEVERRRRASGSPLNASPDTTVTMSDRPARRMLSAAVLRARRIELDGRQACRRSRAGRGRSRSRCSRWRRRFRARAWRRSTATISAQETAVLFGDRQLIGVGGLDLARAAARASGDCALRRRRGRAARRRKHADTTAREADRDREHCVDPC